MSVEHYLIYTALFHVSLSALHWLLEKIYEKTQSTFDDKLLTVVDYLLTVTEWFMAARTGGFTCKRCQEEKKRS